jgi:hypothetical protein
MVLQAFSNISNTLAGLTEAQVKDVLTYHASTSRVALVPWAPAGGLMTLLTGQSLTLSGDK